MRAQIKLGRIFGVEIGLHYSWFIIALLITFSLAGHFRVHNPEWGESLSWTLAIITALLFFASIVVHELSHAVVAKSRGLPDQVVSSRKRITNPEVMRINKEINRLAAESHRLRKAAVIASRSK